MKARASKAKPGGRQAKDAWAAGNWRTRNVVTGATALLAVGGLLWVGGLHLTRFIEHGMTGKLVVAVPALGAAGAILWRTVRVWAPWVQLMAIAGPLFLLSMAIDDYVRISFAAEMSALIVIAGVASRRFHEERKAYSVADKAALMILVFSMAVYFNLHTEDRCEASHVIAGPWDLIALAGPAAATLAWFHSRRGARSPARDPRRQGATGDPESAPARGRRSPRRKSPGRLPRSHSRP